MTSRLVAYAHAAPPGVLRLWVGASHRATAPQLAFELDGVPQTPTVVSAMTPARTPPCLFCGFVEFAGLDSSHSYEVTVRDVNDPTLRHVLRTRPLPPKL